MAEQHKRRIKLIKPGLQLKLTLIFVGLSALSLLLQFVLFMTAVTNVALRLPNDSLVLMEHANGMLLNVLAVSFLAFLPLTFAVGVLTTFRVAGPIFRFETFLRKIADGERPGQFKLRKGDELQDLAELINEVTRPLRSAEEEEADGPSLEDAPSLVRDDEVAEPEEEAGARNGT